MKNLKKILLVALACAVLLTVCMVVVFADDEYTGTMEELTPLVSTAESANEANAAYNAVEAVMKYLTLTPVDPETEGYDDLMTKFDAAILKAAGLLIKKVDVNIKTTLKTATNRVAINKVRRMIDIYGGEQTDLISIMAEIDQLEYLHKEAVAINNAALEEDNNIPDYSLPTYVNENFQPFAPQFVDKDKTIGNYFSFAKKSTNNKLGIMQESNGNRYMYSDYRPTDVTDYNTYTQVSLAQYPAENGYVIEFDFTTFSTLPDAHVNVEAGGFDMSDGRGFPPYYLTIKSNGDLVVGGNGGSGEKVALAGAIVPGEWIHIVIVFDYSDFEYTLIVEGEELATYTAKYKNAPFDLSKGVIRFGSKSLSGSFAVDNFVLYSGSSYRNPNRFQEMSNDEKFIFYSNYMNDESKDVNGKNVAYDMATGLLANYWTWIDEANEIGEYTDAALADPELKSAVDIYLAFDFETLLAVVKDRNLDEYTALTTSLNEMKRAISTVSDRTAKVAEIEKFLEEYSDLIDRNADKNENGTSDFVECNEILSTVKTEIKYDTNAETFIRYMNRFSQVSTISAMQRYYNRAKQMVADNEIDVNIALDEEHPDRDNFAEFVAAYQTYIAAYDLLDYTLKNESSYKIVTCMGFISGYKTEEEWLANDELMNKYIDIVKETILGTDVNGGLLYNPDYEGVQEAVEFFHVVNKFFFNERQEGHISYMTEILGFISTTESYVEKMGMISMLDRYVADNELDYEDVRIQDLLNALETARSELQIREEDYGKILIQNAVYFVNVVEKLRTADTYDSKREYFEEASLLYFNIDITVDGAANAVAIYDACKIELDLIEESSMAFIEAVDFYRACETVDERYAALVECYYNVQFAEISYEGVEDAIAEFEYEYEAYMDYVNGVNDEIVASANVVGSLRSNCGVTPVIAIIIKKIYGV